MPLRDRVVAAGLASLVAALVLTACGSGSTDSTTTASHQAHQGSGGISGSEKRAATRRLQRELGGAKQVRRLKAGRGLKATSVQPAQIVPGGPGPYFSSDTIYPLTNGWQASDHRTFTAIDAGANPADPSVGELGIFRQNRVRVTQTQHVVDVPGAGAVRIVRAPTGRAVATS